MNFNKRQLQKEADQHIINFLQAIYLIFHNFFRFEN